MSAELTKEIAGFERWTLAHMAFSDVSAIASLQPDTANHNMADLVLGCAEKITGPGDPSHRLARALVTHAGRVLAHVGFVYNGPDDDGMEGGILRWDARFADYLSGLGARGKKAAAAIREKATERACAWRASGEPSGVAPSQNALFSLWAWREGGPRDWLRLLARVVWEDELQHESDRAARLRYPAPPMPVARALRDLWGVNVEVARGLLLDERGLSSPLVPRGPAELVALEGHPGLSGLDSPIADRLFTWLLRAAFEMHIKAPFSLNVYDVRVIGGWRELARQVEGLPVGSAASADTRTSIRAPPGALSRVSLGWDIPGVENGTPRALVMVRDEIPAAPGRPASFTLGLSPLWTPKLVHYLSAREDRPLVPWLPLPEIPVGERLHPAAVRLFRGVRVALREGTDERGYARLDWQALALTAAFPGERLPEVIEAWSGEVGPLERAGDRYAPRDPEAKAMLAEAGERSQRGSSGGRKGAMKRWRT